MLSSMMRVAEESVDSTLSCFSCFAKSFLPFTGSTVLVTEDEINPLPDFQVQANAYDSTTLMTVGAVVLGAFYLLQKMRQASVARQQGELVCGQYNNRMTLLSNQPVVDTTLTANNDAQTPSLSQS